MSTTVRGNGTVQFIFFFIMRLNINIIRSSLTENEKSFNRLDQYNGGDNLQTQVIHTTVRDEVLVNKFIESFECLNILQA